MSESLHGPPEEPLQGLVALVLHPRSPCPTAEIGRVLASHLGLHPTDAAGRARYGGGVIASGLTADQAERIREALAGAGVEARPVDAALLEALPRGARVRSLAFAGEELHLRLPGGREVRLPAARLKGLHLYALQPPGGPREARSLSPMRSLPGLRALARRPRPLSREEEEAERSLRWFLRQHHDLGEELELSLRARQLRDALLEAGPPPPEIHLTLLCSGLISGFHSAPASRQAPENLGPFRLQHGEIDYSPWGPERRPHSLDNLLLLLEGLLRAAPQAWMAERISSFLERLAPAELLYFKPEEGQNLERWMQLWIHISEAEGA